MDEGMNARADCVRIQPICITLHVGSLHNAAEGPLMADLQKLKEEYVDL